MDSFQNTTHPVQWPLAHKADVLEKPNGRFVVLRDDEEDGSALTAVGLDQRGGDFGP